MANNKLYPVTRHSATELISHMHTYLEDSQEMEVQCIHSSEGALTILQARARGGSFKQLVGLDRAVTLRFTEMPGVVNVEIGEAKWIDKSIVMIVSMFILWPLTVTSGVGIYRQQKLLSSLTEEMDDYMVNSEGQNSNAQNPGFMDSLSNKADDLCRSSAMQHIVCNADKIMRAFFR